MKKIKLLIFIIFFSISFLAIGAEYDFSETTKISCSGSGIGQECIYEISTGIYASVIVEDINGAQLDSFDNDDNGEPRAFQPRITGTSNNNWGYVKFKISFWDSPSKINPIYIDSIQVTAVDVDGDGAGNEKEGVSFTDFISYTTESNTNLDNIESIEQNTIHYKFYPTSYENQPGINYEQDPPLNMVSVLYRKVHQFYLTTYVYNNNSTGNTSSRMFSIYFGDTYNNNPFPAWSNPISQQVGTFLSGRIIEDINADGNILDEPGFNNVYVACYINDGSTPTNTDTSIASKTGIDLQTNNEGFYAFTIPLNKTAWIAVDSKSIGFSSNIWAEQTYAPKGGYCDKDADSSTQPEELSQAGYCFGGANGAISDGFNDGTGNYDITKAEHYTKVSVTNDQVTDLDFGFSFNVVTNVNDQDDDPNNNRTCQGCLRQFIQNANAISGPNSMKFVPVVPASSNNPTYWRIETNVRMSETNPFDNDTNSPIFRITDSQTVIDGIAYDYQNPSSKVVVDTVAFSGATVGYINTCSIPVFYKVNLEIYTSATYSGDNNDEPSLWNPYTNGQSASIFYVTGDNFTLQNIAAYGGHYIVFVDGANNPTIKNNILGTTASSFLRPKDPNDNNENRSNRGIVIASDADVKNITGTIQHNYISYTRLHGIFLYHIDGGDSFFIKENIINYPSRGWNYENGIGVEENSENVIVECNYVLNSCGVGIETWKSIGNIVIRSNTVEKNGQACGENSGGDEKIGIRITSSNNIVEYNLIRYNQGPGLMVAYDSSRGFSPQYNLISKNSFYSNSKVALDLLKDGENSDGLYASGEDGVTPNNGLYDNDIGNEGIDYPVFTKAMLIGSNLHLEGYIGTSSSKLKPSSGNTWQIEIYKSMNDGNNNGEIETGDGKNVPHGEGKDYIVTVNLTDTDFDNDGNFSKDITVSELSVGDQITAITIDDKNNTSEFSANVQISKGNEIYGYVYHDGYNTETKSYERPNRSKDIYEKWSDKDSLAPTVYIKLCDTNNNVLEIQNIVDGDGYFSFKNLDNGTYIVVEDSDNDIGNCEPNDPEGWVSITESKVSVNLNGNSVMVNFGNFHGSIIRGYAFIDNGGEDKNEANNGIMNPQTEVGIKDVQIRACLDKSCRNKIDEIITDGKGIYEIFIPVEYDGNDLFIVETDLSGYISTGNTRGNMYSYRNFNNTEEERNIIEINNNTAGNISENYNFGDIKKISIQPSQSYSVPIGSSVTIIHTITPHTYGKVAISLISDKGWNYTVFNDINCDGIPDGDPISNTNGYYILNGGSSFAPDEGYCILIKTVIPTNVQESSVEKLNVLVLQDWENTDPNIYDDMTEIEDSITVSTETSGMLSLEKFVKNITQNGDYTKRNEGKPCDILEYKIVFKNIGSQNLKGLSINDNIPAGTEFVEDQYTGKDVYIDYMGTQYTGDINDTPDTDGVELSDNALKVNINTVTGKTHIEPGEEGYILYRVRIKGENCQ